MSVRFLAAALMLVLASPLSANEVVKVTQTYSFRVSVDEQGKVTGAEPLNAIPAPVLATATGMAHDADFEPARVAGRPVPSRTVVNVHMDYEGDQRHLRVVSTSLTSGPKFELAPARYPPGALQGRVSARIWVTVTYLGDGRLDKEASRIDSIEMSNGRRPIEKSPHRKDFEATMWTAIQGWKLLPDEVDGEPIAMTVRMPTRFCADVRGNGECGDRVLRDAQHGWETPDGMHPVDPDIQLARIKPGVPAAEAAVQP